MRLNTIIAGAAALALMTGAALAMHHEPPVQWSETDIGEILTDSDGMTLYIFDKDEAGVTNCYEQCAINWPPLFANEDAAPSGDFTLVERTDGTMMWAHDGMPLYYWKDDFNPGDTTGDGVGGVWHVVHADAM